MFHSYEDFEYDTTRYLLAYHFDRIWQARHTSQTTRDSLRQNIAAQRKEKDVSYRNYMPKSS